MPLEEVQCGGIITLFTGASGPVKRSNNYCTAVLKYLSPQGQGPCGSEIYLTALQLNCYTTGPGASAPEALWGAVLILKL